MKIKQEYKGRVVTYTTAMGVPRTVELGKLTTEDKNYLKRVGYDFEGLIEEVKKKPKKYEGVKDEDNGE